MTAAYVPQVGHKVRKSSWSTYEWVIVLAVGEYRFFGRDQSGSEFAYVIGDPGDGDPGDWVPVVDPWVQVVDPLPDRWLNMYPEWLSPDFGSRKSADHAATPDRIAVLHIWTDEHGDHAEIERLNQ